MLPKAQPRHRRWKALHFPPTIDAPAGHGLLQSRPAPPFRFGVPPRGPAAGWRYSRTRSTARTPPPRASQESGLQLRSDEGVEQGDQANAPLANLRILFAHG